MELHASQPFSNDVMENITIYGRIYPVVNGAVTIPTTNGDMVVTLNTEGKRHDWRYEMQRGDAHFTLVDFNHLLEALHKLIKEDELL